MFPKIYWPQTYFTADYWPPAATATAVSGILDVGGDGITLIGVGFITLELCFPNGMSMRTE